MIVSVTLASFSYFNISKLCVFAFCFNFYLFFCFSFWVLCGSQCPIWNNSVWASYYSVWASTSSLWSSWVFGVLNLQSPSIFPFYVSVSLLNNQASNLQQSKTSSSYPRPHHPRSSPLIDYTGMIRSPSINITLSLCMGFCLVISFMGFGMRLGDGGGGVDDKSWISCGFGVLFSLQISNLIFDSSLQNFRPMKSIRPSQLLKGIGSGKLQVCSIFNLKHKIRITFDGFICSEPSWFWFLSNS